MRDDKMRDQMQKCSEFYYILKRVSENESVSTSDVLYSSDNKGRKYILIWWFKPYTCAALSKDF